MDDLPPELRGALTLAAAVFFTALSGVLNPYVWALLLGVLIGILLLGAWLLLEMREKGPSRRGPRPDPPDAPLRIRIREWGEAMDVWSKVVLRVTGVILICVGGAGALGAGINQLAG